MDYTDRCGGCARYKYCVIDGLPRKIGTCVTNKKGLRTNLASARKCREYVDKRSLKMTKAELNELVETIISIRDRYDLNRSDRKSLADACNIIYHNINILAEDGDQE